MNLQGNFIDFIVAFFGGIIVSFSPCVYPLVPVTLGFIGVEAGSSRLRGLSLSLVYVLGLATTYSFLGLVAAMSGRLFGQISAHPISFLVIGSVCIIAGLSFLGAININFTGIRLQNKVNRSGGFLSAFIFGLVSGLVIGPCITPALGAILVYVASKQNILYGAGLLFVFAYGMGFLLILVGTFSATFFNLLSRSNIWSLRLKKLAGFILIGMGGYFLIKAGRLIW
ncbi:MAG: sulfite exporter TauE/SafE family protein [Candidatus Omnitrophica bacterium]|nr:sulfite exporter TauE/SafE family protein [Candidatus Omnitrophota bacterium]MBU4473168.1 sulfite exporter TauE/SafE family protein [Candidatus Omnitrophota bacterium]MCG2706455.1 sulfite exporter TauE/SafE family protein [Candidatus Omnitrophota bacterium]